MPEAISLKLTSRRRAHSSPEDTLLRAGSLRFHSILLSRGLSARISVGSASRVVGCDKAQHSEPVEFRFESRNVFDALMSTLRFYDFSMAYFSGRLHIIGSLEQAIEAMFALNVATDTPSTFVEKARRLAFGMLKAAIPRFAQRFESASHYALDAAAYELFLDRYMQYTCGKFLSATDDLTDAQVNKFKMIGQLVQDHGGSILSCKHLDVGCGWGGLVGYFQEHYQTNSIGIANSVSQLTYAKENFNVKAILGDFSRLEQDTGQYDLVTIVGMAEHLTPYRRTQLFRLVHQRLKPGGFIYFQCIARPNVWIGGDAYRIAYDVVFPGHYLESCAEMESRFQELGYDVAYARDDAADYAKTTKLWAENLQANEEKISALVGQRNYRVLLGYLAYASKLFSSDRGSLIRYLLQKR